MERYEIEHIERVRKITPECMVLLKSDGSFPLDAPGKIAIYGNAARKTIKGGTGSGDVNVRHYVGIEEGLENAGFTITSKAWLDSYDAVWAKANKEFKAGIKAKIAAEGFPICGQSIKHWGDFEQFCYKYQRKKFVEYRGFILFYWKFSRFFSEQPSESG